MTSYKDPSFQSRTSQASEAKQKALDNLRRKPPVDEAAAAERQAARLKREAAEAEKRSAKLAAAQAAKDEKSAEAAAAKSAQAAPVRTEAELKEARDARYAARKSRK